MKCGAQLEQESQAHEMVGGYEPAAGRLDGDGLKNTVMESEMFGGGASAYTPSPKPTVPVVEEEKTCPKCNYPMRADATKCPNCNFVVGDNPESRPMNANTNGYPRRPTRMADAQERPAEEAPRMIPHAGKLRGTINPYMMNIPQEPSFILKPLQRMNERKPVEPVELELEDGEVVLTRDNTEPSNPSITSKAQAVVSHADGRWYIENRSEQKTTFVLASGRMELHDGDIILLGNRMFEFAEQK